MRLTIVFLLFFTFQVSAHGYAQHITIEKNNVSLIDVFKAIERQTHFLFFYDKDMVQQAGNIDVKLKNATIEQALLACLGDKPFDYAIVKNTIVIQAKQKVTPGFTRSEEAAAAPLPPVEIKGRIVSKEGNPLAGVSVMVVGGGNGTTTNSNGQFTLTIPDGDNVVLEISSVGFQTRTFKVGGKLTDISITLEEKVAGLEDVVVLAYGRQKKLSVTSAVSTVDVKAAFERRPVTDVGRALQGASPGLTITTTSGEPGQTPLIRIRGNTGSLNGTNNPLILVDNVEVPNLNWVNPNDIEAITTLKDAAATAIYGARAAFGALLITTKKGTKNGTVSVNYSANISASTPTDTPKTSRADLGLAYALKQYRWDRTATEMNSNGYYWNDEVVERVRQWIETYGDGKQLGRNMVEGRDFDYRNGSGAYYYRPWDITDIYFNKYTPFQTHNISVNGGNDKVTYNISAGLMNQTGILKLFDDGYNRKNISSFVSAKVNNWMTLRSRTMMSKTENTYPFVYYSNVGYDAMYYIYRWQPIYPYGTYNINGVDYEMDNAINQLKSANKNIDRDNYNQYTVGTTITPPVKGLTIDFDYTYSVQNSTIDWNGGVQYGILNSSVNSTKKFEGVLGYMQPPGGAFDYVQRTASKEIRNTFNGYATYEKTLGAHALKLMAGANVEGSEYESITARKQKIIDYTAPELNLATGDMSATSTHGWWSVAGFFSRLNYSFKDKYYMELNGRYDGSSKFPTSSRWGFFPSASVGWLVSEEQFANFMKPVINNLKFRGSLGQVGNQDVGTNRFISTMTASNSNWLINGQHPNQVSVPGLVSPDLTWEKVTTLDFGVDGSAFKNKFTFTVDWFRRITSGMLSAGVAVPSTLGTGAPLRNYGELTTKGIEVEVSFRHTFPSGIGIQVGGQFFDYKTKITKFASATDPLISANYEGKIVGEIWGYETERLFQVDDFEYDANGNIAKTTLPSGQVKNTYVKGVPTQYIFESGAFLFSPGDVKFRDLNGDGIIDYGKNTVGDHGDLKVLGNTQPRYEYGFRFGISYKGFDFSTFFQGVGKRALWARGNMVLPGYNATEANYEYQLDYWTPENTGAFYPRPINYNSAAQWNYQVQSRYMLNLAYLRCKTMRIGYAVPANVLRRASIKGLNLYASVENFFEFDKLGDIQIDPEINYTSKTSIDGRSFGRSYPYVRTLTVGLQLSF